MSQQIPPSRPRKGFLVIGIVLLILGFFFFYWASRIDWDYVTTYRESVIGVGNPTTVSNYGFGNLYSYSVNFPTIEMHSNDFLVIECPTWTLNLDQSVFILLFGQTFLKTDIGRLVYTNNQTTDQSVSVYLATQAIQYGNGTTLSVTLTLNHYETPQWVYFGIGVVLASLAVIPVFKSKK